MLRIIVGDRPSTAPAAAGRLIELPGALAFAAPSALPDGTPATVADLARQAGWDGADCYVHLVPERHALPLDALDGDARLVLAPRAWDRAGRMLRALAPVLDAVLVDRAGAPPLRRLLGGERVVEALLDGWDEAASPRTAPESARDIDVLVLLGDVAGGHEELALAALAQHSGSLRLRAVAGTAAEAAPLAARARLVVATSAHGEACAHVFAAAAAGACVLAERGNPTLPTILRPELDYATFADDVPEVVARLLEDDALRLAIAAAGQAALVAHRREDHLRAALAELGERLPLLERRRTPGRRALARLLAEQRRLGGCGAADGPALLAAAGCPTAEVRRQAALVAVDAGDPDAAAATAWALAAAPDAADAGLLLARADAAADADLPADRIWAAQAALAAAADGVDCSLATPADPEWRLALELAVAEAADDAAARHAAARWVRARAGWHLAVAAHASLPPGRRLALLGPRRVDPLPVRAARAGALAACGRLDEAIALLGRIAAERPRSAAARHALAAGLARAGRRDEGAAALDALADLLALDPATDADGAALRDAAAALRAPATTVALTWCSGPDLDAAIALRAAGEVPADVLRVLALPGAVASAAAAVADALARRGLDVAALPATEVVADDGALLAEVAAAACVIARRDAPEALLATGAGVPVLAPVAPPHALAHAA